MNEGEKIWATSVEDGDNKEVVIGDRLTQQQLELAGETAEPRAGEGVGVFCREGEQRREVAYNWTPFSAMRTQLEMLSVSSGGEDENDVGDALIKGEAPSDDKLWRLFKIRKRPGRPPEVLPLKPQLDACTGPSQTRGGGKDRRPRRHARQMRW